MEQCISSTREYSEGLALLEYTIGNSPIVSGREELTLKYWRCVNLPLGTKGRNAGEHNSTST